MPPSAVVTRSIDPPQPLAANMQSLWMLDPSIAFINHGCFGARLKSISKAQTLWRDKYESRPIELLDRNRAALIRKARTALAEFIGAQQEDLGFVTNATGGINAVLRSLKFNPGDELLTTNHVYNAIRMTMAYLAHQTGAKYIELEIPLPLHSLQDVFDRIVKAVTQRTRILVIDHVTSPTAVIFPVKELIEYCAARNVDVLVDGAHAPGMLELDVGGLNAAYYAGNLHKWVCAPSGAGFLWVRPDKQKGIHPTTISHFLEQGLAAEFEWQGTRDITPWLCVPDAIAQMGSFGWDNVMRHNHQMAVWAQQMLCERWNVEPASPLDGSMLGSMATVRLPGQDRLKRKFVTIKELHDCLYDTYQVEVAVVEWPAPPAPPQAPAQAPAQMARGGASPHASTWWVRPCCQVYNIPSHYERLADAILELTA